MTKEIALSLHDLPEILLDFHFPLVICFFKGWANLNTYCFLIIPDSYRDERSDF